jgi:hypothetical protein
LRTLTYGTIAALDPEAREALRQRVIAHGQWVSQMMTLSISAIAELMSGINARGIGGPRGD